MANKKVVMLTVEEQNERDSNLRYQAVLVAEGLKPNSVQDLLKSAAKVFEYLKAGTQ